MRGAGAAEEQGDLGKEQEWEMGRRKEFVLQTGWGKEHSGISAASGLQQKKAMGKEFGTRDIFGFPSRQKVRVETSSKLLLPKHHCCSQPSWADFLLLPAGLDVPFWRNGMATSSCAG